MDLVADLGFELRVFEKKKKMRVPDIKNVNCDSMEIVVMGPRFSVCRPQE
jgi:hypothetical protein